MSSSLPEPDTASSEHRPSFRLALFSVLLVTLIAALAAGTGTIHARGCGHDTFFLLDNGWRALHGQRVHVDYASAWGPVTFLVIAAGLLVSGGAVAAISYANSLFALIAGLWCVWLVSARSRSTLATAYSGFVTLLAAAPFALGEAPMWTSHGMLYNRYGYALLALILVECFVPHLPGGRTSLRARLEPVLTGMAAGITVFLKPTYFIDAAVLMSVSLLFWDRRKQRALGYAAGMCIAGAALLTYLRWDVAAMLGDLASAAAARSATLGIRKEYIDVPLGALVRTGTLMIAAFACARGGETARGLSRWRWPVAALIAMGADVLLLLTSAQPASYPLVALFSLIMLWQGEGQSLLARARPGGNTNVLPVLAALLLAFPVLLVQAAGMVYGFAESRLNPDPAGVLRFESPRLHPLVLYDVDSGSIDRYSNGRAYVSAINEGIRLIEAHTAPGEKIANLDMFNPFAYALGRAPVEGGMAAAAFGYTLDDRHHPSPERFFGDAMVVMVPKQPASPAIFQDGCRRIYMPALERDFRLAAESPQWWLYRRLHH